MNHLETTKETQEDVQADWVYGDVKGRAGRRNKVTGEFQYIDNIIEKGKLMNLQNQLDANKPQFKDDK